MRGRSFVLGILAAVLFGCAGHPAVVPSPLSHHAGPTPFIRQNGEVPVQWTRIFWGSSAGSFVPTILPGPDGNMWYTDYSGGNLIRMTMKGGTKLFPLIYNNGSTVFHPSSLTVGTDNKFYLGSQSAAFVGVMTTAGSFKAIAIPSGDVASYGGMTVGPDGNVWFTEVSHVGKITTGGVITEVPWGDGSTNNYYSGIVTGPDGNLWATEYSSQAVERINPATGTMKQFTLSASNCSPTAIITASDGNLWVNCANIAALGRLTTAGAITLFPDPFGIYFYAPAMVRGPDGNPWFAGTNGHVIEEFNIANNSLIVYAPPSTYGNAVALATGPDGNMWTVSDSSEIDVYIINVIGVSPAAINFTGLGQVQTITVTENGTASWTAVSSHPAVATVAPGSSASQFKVTSVASGYTKIIVSDAIGNSFVVRVHVP